MSDYEYPAWIRYDTALRPCPFCGCKPYGVFGEPGYIVIECETEECGNWETDAATKEVAVQRWNKRAVPAQFPTSKETP